MSWSCPICGGASHVEVPRVTPSQPFYPIPPKPIDDQRIEPAVPYVLQWLSAHDPIWGNSLWRALAEWCKCLVTRSRRLGCLQFLLSPPIFAGCQPILLYSEGSRASPGIPHFASGPSRSVPVHANDWCKTCGRPQVAGPRVLKASPGCHFPRALCVCLLPGAQPVNKDLAARSCVVVGAVVLTHVLPVLSRFLATCVPPTNMDVSVQNTAQQSHLRTAYRGPGSFSVSGYQPQLRRGGGSSSA